MPEKPHARTLADLERQHGIPPDTSCGLSAADMSRAIVALSSGPRRPGEPVGYDPVASLETRLDWLRAEFGPDADVERIRLQEQFFAARMRDLLDLDWQLPGPEFDRAVMEGLRRHFPELSDDARRVIAGNSSYSQK